MLGVAQRFGALDYRNPSLVYILCVSFFILFCCVFKICEHGLKYFKAYRAITDFHVKINLLSRVVSSVHAIFATIFAVLVLYFNKDIYQHQLLYKSYGICVTLSFAMGYFFYDFLLMTLFKEIREASSYLHHFVSIAAFHACAVRGVFPHIAIIRLTSEFSTPFINNRWFMYALNMKDNKWYMYNGYVMFISFAICRIVPIIPLWYNLWFSIGTPSWNQIGNFDKFICIFSSMPLDILNVYWFSKILKGVLKHRKAAKSN